MIKIYLALFNLISVVGWSMVWLTSVGSLLSGSSPRVFYENYGFVAYYVQSLAVMEVVHSAVGFVKSPLHTTFFQVLSRVVQVWWISGIDPVCQHHWSIYLMTISWATAEIPRYTFYTIRQFKEVKDMPFPIVWLRYSLFLVLYPTGITGEVLQLLQMMIRLYHEGKNGLLYFFIFLLILYIPGSPYMIMNMVKQRRKTLKNLKLADEEKKEKKN